MSFFQAPGDMIEIRPRRSIGGLFPDVVVSETHDDQLTITSHPVEQGANINDHAYKTVTKVTLAAGVSDSSLLASGENPSQEFYEKLLELQSRREPFDIVTGKRLYRNMLLQSLQVVTNASAEQALSVTAVCQEIIIVKTQVTSVAPRKNQATPAKTGATAEKGQKQAMACLPAHTVGAGQAKAGPMPHPLQPSGR
ncbi:phage baseplate protein [Desulfovibrio cuneatus]|uniref:phage baseplate protein n=1 Tax=Desulfovibrio cuneatus TaxID=159728 RepID=UPI0004081B18|nr:hypothetical protein [Desulfovibrio cuneatus]